MGTERKSADASVAVDDDVDWKFTAEFRQMQLGEVRQRLSVARDLIDKVLTYCECQGRGVRVWGSFRKDCQNLYCQQARDFLKKEDENG